MNLGQRDPGYDALLEAGLIDDPFARNGTDCVRTQSGQASALGDPMMPSPREPARVARRIADATYRQDDVLTLRRWRGSYYRWSGSSWAEIEDASIRAALYRHLEYAVYLDDKDVEKPWSPTARKISDVADALDAVCHLSEHIDPPAWIEGDHDHQARDLVAVRNGLLHVPTRTLYEHDPRFFNSVAVPFAFEPHAATPTRWLAFLDQLWGKDPQARSTLQEWLGYVVSGRTDLHKILLLIGPTRAGKGVIARVARAMIGAGNTVGPTLNSLGQNFGLQPLIGKSLAIVSDARLGSGNTTAVVERLLSISGEDMLTIDRKYKEPWSGKLGTRFLIISNELPSFRDASAAIANRMIILTLSTSFLGRENTKLTDELIVELPGILNWALEGLDRLNTAGKLVVPKSSNDAVIALIDGASPVSAFVREKCTQGPAHTVEVAEIYKAWRNWCEQQGINRPGSAQSFGRDLHAVIPGLNVSQPGPVGQQVRTYEGVKLGKNNGD